jgi:hypothetical protein
MLVKFCRKLVDPWEHDLFQLFHTARAVKPNLFDFDPNTSARRSFFYFGDHKKKNQELRVRCKRRQQQQNVLSGNTTTITYYGEYHINQKKMTSASNFNKTKISVLDKDILCGRGKGLESFPGNRIFRQIIKQHAAEYGNPKTSRSERSHVVQFIANQLVGDGMRFVKRDKKGWVVLGDHEVKLKVRS